MAKMKFETMAGMRTCEHPCSMMGKGKMDMGGKMPKNMDKDMKKEKMPMKKGGK